MFLRILIVMSFMLAGMLAHPTRASERVALVIGNSDHEHVSRLANPANDASDIGAALGRLGFDVTRLENTSYQDMRRGLQDFKRAASGADTEALLAHLEEPGLEVSLMFRKVRDAVRKSTNNTQEPVVYGSLSSEHNLSRGIFE